ncbi:hypothetical protein HK097_008643 [Rhizophlyctis rosea]|uniref:Uncharacterized protein n=1 Tax=Rhizophlyctis rosea TaxID=64517 RepID=A0AAD5SBK9_9FUNG|nr:hypothetical protein HK097_008643 [Rhizophlyctis rosea]
MGTDDNSPADPAARARGGDGVSVGIGSGSVGVGGASGSRHMGEGSESVSGVALDACISFTEPYRRSAYTVGSFVNVKWTWASDDAVLSAAAAKPVDINLVKTFIVKVQAGRACGEVVGASLGQVPLNAEAFTVKLPPLEAGPSYNFRFGNTPASYVYTPQFCITYTPVPNPNIMLPNSFTTMQATFPTSQSNTAPQSTTTPQSAAAAIASGNIASMTAALTTCKQTKHNLTSRLPRLQDSLNTAKKNENAARKELVDAEKKKKEAEAALREASQKKEAAEEALHDEEQKTKDAKEALEDVQKAIEQVDSEIWDLGAACNRATMAGVGFDGRQRDSRRRGSDDDDSDGDIRKFRRRP